MAKRPTVTTKCVADSYHAHSERIIEFGANDGTGTGGLISFNRLHDGTLVVCAYRVTGPVVVMGGNHD